MKQFEVGSTVKWSWGDGEASGTVKERFTEKVTRQIKGNDVTRKATGTNPAYLIEQDDGDRVLKSHSELDSAS